MKFKGTKGKWVIDGFHVTTGIEQNYETICDVTPITEYPTVSERSLKESKANALLISKAPEMLEMLQLWCMDMEERGRAYGDCYTMTKALIKEATEL